MTEHDNATSGVPFPPPLAFLGALAAGFGLHYLKPVRILPLSGWYFLEKVGAVVFLAGCALGFSGLVMFRLARTSPFPERPTKALVVRGPYLFTRNPMYLAMTLVSLGVALFANALWPLLFLVPAVLVIRYAAIEREERYLLSRFGQAYEEYRSRVRRWL